jgi:hypothetical protein
MIVSSLIVLVIAEYRAQIDDAETISHERLEKPTLSTSRNSSNNFGRGTNAFSSSAGIYQHQYLQRLRRQTIGPFQN